ncbi:cation-transporting P-type ATPase [Arenimonas caeni]|jgi:magnesium-transporting ATPase (P-type)|uniref:cation-transporting P-type ATPase n=1 Tax=Arenimonas caeni TaxID=2058085 RepID=UPI002A3624B0|nr:cation-transporting P-type ATPase [Arenimonas caeni]MDY0022479.1 cation-transporting P-type ATPase [Arenimonas caeni]
MSDWHTRDIEGAIQALFARADGLAGEEAARRLQVHGPNRLPEPARTHPALRFLRQFHNILIYVLLGAAVVTALLGHGVDTAVILAVVLANAIIGHLQEGKAERAMEALRGLLAPRAAVLRDGRRVGVDASALVPGDVVLLEAGDRVPADLRLLQVRGLQVQEALLTGESVPVEKQPAPVAADAPLGDRSCLAFSGTLVTAGQGRGLVVGTGADTEIGRISGLLTRVETLETPLVRQMDAFARGLTFAILGAAALLLVLGHFAGGRPFAEVFMAVVGLAVAAIPEGLPAVLTITLAVGVQAMARRNAIVRRLPAIETLGAVSVICTDKTGTLTRNEMVVATVALAGVRYRVEGEGYAPQGRLLLESGNGPDPPALAWLARACALCNDAALHSRDGEWQVEGDPMEGALLALAGKAGVDLGQVGAQWPRVDAIPFDARHRFMASLHHDHTGHAVALAKGAPERLLAMCAHQRGENGDEALDVDAWCEAADAIAARGQRVLAFALREMPAGSTRLDFADVEGPMVLLGLVGLVDPPRPEAVAAVADCRRAGIRVKMITGDHAGTAAAIGAEVGLEAPGRVLTGADLDQLDDDALRETVWHTDVFARTSPEHKLRLVMALQSLGRVVAMTGDGVNDAPALKRADAGIAMGRGGSEAAKEAAELVLADDNFASIAAAVREGRTVYDNLRKVIRWTLPTNAGEAGTIIIALLAGLALPVTPVQILWVNLATAITLGLALAFEPIEANTMRRPPRRPEEPLLNRHLAWHITLVASLFVLAVFGMFEWALARGHSIELARTMAVNTLVVLEIFHLFHVRNLHGTSFNLQALKGTPVIWLTITIVTAAQFAITYVPALQQVFGTAAVPLAEGVVVVSLGMLLLMVLETEKALRLRRT